MEHAHKKKKIGFITSIPTVGVFSRDKRNIPNMKIHSTRIRDIKETEHKTQAQLAEIMDIDISTLSRAMGGENYLPIKAAVNLYLKFGYSLDWIYGISEVKKIDNLRLVDIADIIKIDNGTVSISIPGKFFEELLHPDIKNEVLEQLNFNESDIPLIKGVGQQQRKFYFNTDSRYSANIKVEEFKSDTEKRTAQIEQSFLIS